MSRLALGLVAERWAPQRVPKASVSSGKWAVMSWSQAGCVCAAGSAVRQFLTRPQQAGKPKASSLKGPTSLGSGETLLLPQQPCARGSLAWGGGGVLPEGWEKMNAGFI